jgi:hypothetical protein
MRKYWLGFLWVCILIPFMGCEKEYSCENCNDKQLPPEPVPIGDSVLFFQFSADNKNYKAIAYENSYIVASSLNWSGTEMDSGVVINSVILGPSVLLGVQGPNSLVLYRGVIKNYDALTATAFRNFFTLGSYNYEFLQDVIPPFTPVKNGIALRWSDENSVPWRTDNGSGNQTGSFFTITGKEDMVYPWTFTPGSTRFTADFKCKLYDSQGNMKLLTNGKLAFYFAKDY